MRLPSRDGYVTLNRNARTGENFPLASLPARRNEQTHGHAIMSKRILITGGAGFIGSHLSERLLREGHEVICMDNFFTGSKQNILHLTDYPGFEVIRHDVTVPYVMEVDQIYNLACPASPPHYQFDPIHTMKTSVLGALNMLGLAKRCKAKILQASTSEVYGDPMVHPQPETYWGNVNPVGVRSCYDEGKRCAETLFMDYRRMNGVDYDLAAHFTVIRQAGICLCGKPIAAVFGQVPRENYLDSICRDVQDAPMQILDQPLYLTLNLCRVLAACRQGLVLSKCEGVCWAMQEDSLAEFLPMLKQAQLCYQSAEEFIWESEPLKRFAKIALNQIDSALLKTQQDEKRRICQMEQNKAEKWCKIEIYNEYLKKIPSLLVQIHAVEKMYEKAKLEQQMLTTQPENDSRRQYQARLDSTERQCACRLQEMQEELRLVQGLKAQLEEELGEQLGCK